MNFPKWLIATFLLHSALLVNGTILNEEPHLRNKRQLLFPNSTVLQLSAGIGSPSPMDMVNVNWAFQANFQLPWNRTQIPVDIFNANSGYDGESRKKRDLDEGSKDGYYENDAQLYHLYKFVEDVLNSLGDNGTSCVLQALCQFGSEPLHSEDAEDLLHELGSFVLNPTNNIHSAMTQNQEAYPYIQAYERGQKGEECHKIYDKCSTPLIEIFTKLHDEY